MHFISYMTNAHNMLLSNVHVKRNTANRPNTPVDYVGKRPYKQINRQRQV